MRHKVFLNDQDLIETVYRGDLKYSELKEIFEVTYKLGFDLQDKNKKVRVLADISQIGKVPVAEIAIFAARAIKSFPFDKIAVWGARRELELAAKLILGLAGKRKVLGIFKTREQALAWLK